MELEMNDAVLHQRLRLGCCPVPRKEDCLGCMGEAGAEAMAAVREEVAAGGTLTKAPGSKPSLSWGTCVEVLRVGLAWVYQVKRASSFLSGMLLFVG